MSSLIVKRVSAASREETDQALEQARAELAAQGLSSDSLDLLLVAVEDAAQRSRVQALIDGIKALTADPPTLERLIEERLGAITRPPPTMVRQAELNADRRREFLENVPCLARTELAAVAGLGADAQTTLDGWIEQRRIFALPRAGDVLFPEFQFSADGRPKAIIGQVLDAFGGAMGPWQLAVWFVTPNVGLADQAPLDVLDQRPEAVLSAASALLADNLF